MPESWSREPCDATVMLTNIFAEMIVYSQALHAELIPRELAEKLAALSPKDRTQVLVLLDKLETVGAYLCALGRLQLAVCLDYRASLEEAPAPSWSPEGCTIRRTKDGMTELVSAEGKVLAQACDRFSEAWWEARRRVTEAETDYPPGGYP